jgi:hypothetical protein
MKSKLTSTAIAAAIIASSSPANAQHAKPPVTTQKDGEDGARRAQEQERRERVEREKVEAEKAGEAVGRATTTATTIVIEAGQGVARTLDQPGKYNAVAATWNPIGLIVGRRVSFNVEFAPITHHVIIVSTHFANPGEETTVGPGFTYQKRFTGAGGELGYRYYTGHRGMNGIFIGPSLVGGIYNASLLREESVFTNIGIAGDVGIQHIFLDHIAVGGGLGIEYLRVSKSFGDVSLGPSTIASAGFKPRMLVQAGYAF